MPNINHTEETAGLAGRQNALGQRAYCDELLGLPNGPKLELDAAGLENREGAALIHFDINQFSIINDLYGWDAGDDVLAQVRDAVLQLAPAGSRLYRTGDDDFCLLLEAASQEKAAIVAREILERFKKPWNNRRADAGVPLYATVKMGVVYGGYIQPDIRALLHRTTNAADNHQGYTVYDVALDEEHRRRLELRQSLIACVQRDMEGFSVCYQPIVQGRTGRWVGAEALCRWDAPNGGQVPALQFLRELEALGMIDRLDAWVLETAVAQCKRWGLDKRKFYLDINVSPLQVPDDGYVLRLVQILHSRGFPLEKLNLEITESKRVDFSDENIQNWKKLCREGINLSLDDFGTGFNAFSSLINLPAKILKTERLFIEELEQNQYQQYLMKVLVDMAHTVGMRIVTEGVETEGQRDMLREYGVDYMQGHLFSRPLSAPAFQKCLHEFV